MQELLVNRELLVEYPDGFHVMTEEERNKLSALEDGQFEGISDPDRHILIMIGWKQAGRIVSMLLGEKDLARNMEKQIRRSIRSFDYKLHGLKEEQIAGLKARGCGYAYKAQDTQMYAESYVMKRENTLYYLHFYARAARKEECVPVWKEILEKIRLQ